MTPDNQQYLTKEPGGVMTEVKATLQSKALLKPKVEWGYRPDSTVQENPFPPGSSLHANWDMSKAMHDVNRVLKGDRVTVTEAREFVPFPKIPRFNRDTVITEKLDGTNSAVVVTPEGDVYAQSRNRIITPDADNHGFAAWVAAHADELREQLGEGRHFGEWWGHKIGKRYSAHMESGDKRFSLFNVHRWTGRVFDDWRCEEAPLCHIVPVLAKPERLDTVAVDESVQLLRENGSRACPGAVAEGVIVFHTKGNVGFKITLEKDAEWKGPNRV